MVNPLNNPEYIQLAQLMLKLEKPTYEKLSKQMDKSAQSIRTMVSRTSKSIPNPEQPHIFKTETLPREDAGRPYVIIKIDWNGCTNEFLNKYYYTYEEEQAKTLDNRFPDLKIPEEFSVDNRRKAFTLFMQAYVNHRLLTVDLNKERMTINSLFSELYNHIVMRSFEIEMFNQPNKVLDYQKINMPEDLKLSLASILNDIRAKKIFETKGYSTVNHFLTTQTSNRIELLHKFNEELESNSYASKEEAINERNKILIDIATTEPEKLLKALMNF